MSREEEFRPIPGHEGFYVSNLGRFVDSKGVELRLHVSGHVIIEGVRYVAAWAVLEAFGFPRPSPRHKALRLDFNPANLALDNLLWGRPEDRETIKRFYRLLARRKVGSGSSRESS